MNGSKDEGSIDALEMAFMLSITVRDVNLLTAAICLGADPFKPYHPGVSLSEKDFSPYSHAVEIGWVDGINAILSAITASSH